MMKRMFLGIVLTLVIAIGFGVNSASALLILSGDTNIVDPLTGSQGAAINAGNQQFFTNILQGGNSVGVLETLTAPVWNPHLVVNTFYNSLIGVSSSILTGTITDAQLAGIDLFVAPIPDHIFTASESASLSNFLTGGGSVFFLGEHAGFATGNQNINNVLPALGSSMSIIPNSAFDPGVWNSAVIASDPLTAGVATFTYNAPSQVGGGTNLFFGGAGQPFVSYEGAQVPEPSSLLLLGSGLLGLAAWRRKFRA